MTTHTHLIQVTTHFNDHTHTLDQEVSTPRQELWTLPEWQDCSDSGERVYRAGISAPLLLQCCSFHLHWVRIKTQNLERKFILRFGYSFH